MAYLYNSPPLGISALPPRHGYLFPEPCLVSTEDAGTPLAAVLRLQKTIAPAAYEQIITGGYPDLQNSPGAVTALFASIVTLVSVRTALARNATDAWPPADAGGRVYLGARDFMAEIKRLATDAPITELRALVDEATSVAAVNLLSLDGIEKSMRQPKPQPSSGDRGRPKKGRTEFFRRPRISRAPLEYMANAEQMDDGVARGADAQRIFPPVMRFDVKYASDPEFFDRVSEAALVLLSDGVIAERRTLSNPFLGQPSLYVSGDAARAQLVPVLFASAPKFGLAVESAERTSQLRAATGSSAALPRPVRDGSGAAAAVHSGTLGLDAAWNKSTTGLATLRPYRAAAKVVAASFGEGPPPIGTDAMPAVVGLEPIVRGIAMSPELPRAAAAAQVREESFWPGPRRYAYTGTVLPEDFDCTTPALLNAMILSTLALATSDRAVSEVIYTAEKSVPSSRRQSIPRGAVPALSRIADVSWARTVLSTGMTRARRGLVPGPTPESPPEFVVIQERSVVWDLITMDIPFTAEEVVLEILLYLHALLELKRVQLLVPGLSEDPRPVTGMQEFINARATRIRALLTASGKVSAWRRDIVTTITRLFFRLARRGGESLSDAAGFGDSIPLFDKTLASSLSNVTDQLVPAFRAPGGGRDGGSEAPEDETEFLRSYVELASIGEMFFGRHSGPSSELLSMEKFVRTEALAALVRILFNLGPGSGGRGFTRESVRLAHLTLQTLATRRAGVLTRLFPYLGALVATSGYARVARATLAVDSPLESQAAGWPSKTEVSAFTLKSASDVLESQATALSHFRTDRLVTHSHKIGVLLANHAITVRLSLDDAARDPILFTWNVPLQRRRSLWSLRLVDSWAAEASSETDIRRATTATARGGYPREEMINIANKGDAEMVSVRLAVKLRQKEAPETLHAHREVRVVLEDHFGDNGSAVAYENELFFRLELAAAAAAAGWIADVSVVSVEEASVAKKST